MFGLSLGEIMVLLIVGIVVVGPKNLPNMMRTAGKWVTKLRRMSTDLRAQSGIDDLIRHEGLENEINQLRSLSRMNVVDTLMTPALSRAADPYPTQSLPSASGPRPAEFTAAAPLREREYPLVGCDAHGALADDAGPFHGFVEAAQATEETPADEPSTPDEPAIAAAAEVPAPAEPKADPAPGEGASA